MLDRKGEDMGKKLGFHIGLRTIKTAFAVIISILLVDIYGTSSSKLIFAMLGAMVAVQPTFKESVESCLTQIVGVLFGAAVGVLLLYLRLPSLAVVGIGVVLVITLYNMLRIRYAPGLPCLIVVILCTTPGIQPITYALGRIWDSTIGMAVGMAINMLIFPYDNSRRIRDTAESLDRDVIAFLEDMFDGDDRLPDTRQIGAKLADLAAQLKIFANQKLILRLRRQHRELDTFRLCEGKARELVARMEVLSLMEQPGQLTQENCNSLRQLGAVLPQPGIALAVEERDVVTNYHIRQILKLRRELLEVLEKK